MYKQEKINPYDQHGEKKTQVERMFNNIAPTYDVLNHRMSWNIDRGWRREAIKQLQEFKPKTLLDIATGTGDFAILAAQMLQPEEIVGIDISTGMMDIAREKVREKQIDHIISFQQEDSNNLSFADNSFDALTVAFGIRNFQNLDRCLKEMQRVLVPGGHLSILELTSPVNFPMRQLFKLYSHTVLPVYGKMMAGDMDAYKYLTATIESFPQAEELLKSFIKSGFSKIHFKRLTFGICTMYLAEK